MKEHLKFDFRGKAVEGERFDILVDDVADKMPKSIPRSILYESLRHLAGEKLTVELMDETCWRLAGNIPRLLAKRAVTPWNAQPVEEWVPVQVKALRRRRGGKGQPGWQISFQVLAGMSCPMVIQKFWSQRFCGYMAKPLGFRRKLPSEKSGKLPEFLYRHPTEFMTLRLSVLIEPKLSKTEPDFEKTDVPQSLLDWNREQLKHRDRVQHGYTCPWKFTRVVKCFQCAAGYLSCRAGTHRLDFTQDYCSYCGNDNMAFDADLSEEMCVNCYETRAMKRS